MFSLSSSSFFFSFCFFLCKESAGICAHASFKYFMMNLNKTNKEDINKDDKIQNGVGI